MIDIKMDEPVQFMTAIEHVKVQIKELEKKLYQLEREEQQNAKSPAEQAYKKVYGKYPPDISPETGLSYLFWDVFEKGYNAGKGESEEKEISEEVKGLQEKEWSIQVKAPQESAHEPGEKIHEEMEEFLKEKNKKPYIPIKDSPYKWICSSFSEKLGNKKLYDVLKMEYNFSSDQAEDICVTIEEWLPKPQNLAWTDSYSMGHRDALDMVRLLLM